MELTCDKRYAGKANLETVVDCMWQQVESAVRKLDASVFTEVLLEGEGVGQLSIGGGNGQYFVSIFTGDERSFTLLDRLRRDAKSVRLVSAGQVVMLPADHVVDLDVTIEAVRFFFDHHQLNPTQQWLEE